MTDIPDGVVERALSVKTEDCPESLQYALIRGLSAMGFEKPSAETWDLLRAAGRVFVEWEREQCALLADTTKGYPTSVSDAIRSRRTEREI